MTNSNTLMQNYINKRLEMLKHNDEYAEELLIKIKNNEEILKEKLLTLQLLIDKVSSNLISKRENDFYLTYHKLEPLNNEHDELLQYFEVLWNVIKKFKTILEK